MHLEDQNREREKELGLERESLEGLVALSPGIPREFLVPTSLPQEIALFPGNPLPAEPGKNLGLHLGNRGSASPRHG